MYEDKSTFEDADFRSFFQAIRSREIKDIKELDLDIQPVINFFRQQGPNKDLNNMTLTRKLCWLLGTCGFLRPNDILCIDLSSDKFQLDAMACVLQISIPKEKRGGKRIFKYTTLKCHDDPLLCPVQTITEYIRRIDAHKIMVPHPKDGTILYRPLIRDARCLDKEITADRISKHISFITDMIALPKNERRPKARAIGPTEAIKKGARVDDIVVHGNWSSSVMFDRFYRLNAATATNFTSMVLS